MSIIEHELGEPNMFEKEFLKPMYAKSNLKFQKKFQENPLGFECNVCDRLWFLNDLYDVISKTNCIELLSKEFPEEKSSKHARIVELL